MILIAQRQLETWTYYFRFYETMEKKQKKND